MNHTNAARRTFQKVRRDSMPIGCEAELWRPTNKRAMRLALSAAEKFDLAHKLKGKRNGPLGHVGLQVHRALWAVVSFRDGRLEPSIEYLMRTVRRSRAAVVGALARLRSCGFLTWLRRLEYTGGPPGQRGPQVKQATNAYQLQTPPAALRLVAALIVPDCERTRVSERLAALGIFEREAFNQSSLGLQFSRWAEAFTTNASPPGGLNPASRFKQGGRG